MESSVQQQVDLRIRAKGETLEGEVYRYLTCNRRWNRRQGKAMLAQAAQDYWLADARQYVDPELAKTTAISCIERLEHRISQLRQAYGLALPSRLSSEQPELIELLIELIAEARLNSQSLTSASQSLISMASSLAGGMVNLQSSTGALSQDDSVVCQDQDIFADDNLDALSDIAACLEEGAPKG